MAAGAALQLQGGITVSGEALTLNGTGVNNDGALRSISGNNQYLSAITLGSSSLIAADSSLNLLGITGTNTNLTFDGAGSIFVNGAVATGTGGLTKNGAGTLRLFGTNTYTGVTTINDGTSRITNGNAIADTGAVVVNTSGIFVVNSSETIGSLAGTGNVVIAASQTLTTGGDGTSTTFSGAISENFFPGARLTKLGTGT